MTVSPIRRRPKAPYFNWCVWGRIVSSPLLGEAEAIRCAVRYSFLCRQEHLNRLYFASVPFRKVRYDRSSVRDEGGTHSNGRRNRNASGYLSPDRPPLRQRMFEVHAHVLRWASFVIMIRMPTAPGVFFQSAMTSATPGSSGSTGLTIANRSGWARCTSTA